MGNLFDRPKLKIKVRSSCCTTVITDTDEVDIADESKQGVDIQLSYEDGSVIYHQRPKLQRQNAIVEANDDKKK